MKISSTKKIIFVMTIWVLLMIATLIYATINEITFTTLFATLAISVLLIFQEELKKWKE